MVRRIALSSLFLIAAVFVVAVAMLALGGWISSYVSGAISRGVAETAASSIGSLIANTLERLGPERPLSAEAKAELDAVFLIGNDADTTRLLQIRIRDVAGNFIYESFGGIITQDRPGDFTAAMNGQIVARVVDLTLQPIGPLTARPIAVLEIHTPIQGSSEPEEPFAVADLYYSARSIQTIQHEAQLAVWLLLSAAGVVVIGALYIMVARASRTIVTQRANLARNLEASRRLADENQTLHAASERLRIDAALSNEALLASVGSDLHDGPIQLLTLLILRLSKSARKAKEGPDAQSLQQNVRLATEAMEELRSISSGLVLPELADLEIGEAITLAITRHEAATGKTVQRRLEPIDAPAPMTVKIGAYRIVQEALNNAYWHGDSSSPAVTARVADDALVIEVSNRAPAATRELGEAKDESIGLRSMRFRAEALGGSLLFEIAPDGLATIRTTLPLSGSTAHLASSEDLTTTMS